MVTGRAGRAGSPLRGRGYAAVAAVVLLVAAALRFYDLSGDSLWYDEAVAALNSQGSFAETVERTRAYNTSPILYPLALWAVQKVETSNFSVRLLPAVGSAATVAVLLFLLPGAGAGRRTALFAGALAAVSAAAVAEAHGVREYSLDALVAALLIVGLLRHLGGGGKVLLPLALFLGPFVQYGLVLFGGAVLAAAFLFGGGSGSRSPTGPSARGGISRAALRARLRSVVPAAAAFAAACVGSWLATLRGQLEGGALTMGHLLRGYYRGDPSDVLAALDFVGSRVRETLAYHLTGPFASATALAAALLVASVLARRLASRSSAAAEAAARPPDLAGRVLPALFGVSLLVASAAALAGAYPLGPLRQSAYLGPVVFVAAAVVWGLVADAAAAAVRRPVAGWLTAVALAGGAWAGAREIAREAPFGVGGNAEAVVAELAGRAREGDLVYVSGVATPPVRFYLRDRPEGPVFGKNGCYREFTDCAREALAIVRSRLRAPDRAWVIHGGGGVSSSFRASNPALQVERVVSGRQDLFLVPNLGEVAAAENRNRLAEYESAFDDRAEEPAAVSFFELHHREDFLYYRRTACSAEDLEARFFLHFRPADAAGRRTVNRDFEFPEYGVLADGKCVARVPVPPGDFDLVSTGQWFPGAPPLWEAQWRLDLVHYAAALRAIRSGEIGPPALRGPFDLYLRGRELLYYREPCAPEDVRAGFLLHLFDHDRVGQGARRDFENRDFGFDGMGVVRGGACLASAPLPDRRIASVRTGQWVAGAPAIWTGVARVDFERHRSALDAIVSGRAGPPAARGTFDLYRDGRRLLYHREDCRGEDVEADFFLDLHPSEVESLPPRRREEGFEDLHFPFSNHGVVLDGQCLLLVTVPDYGIRRLTTGQFAPGEGTLWQVEIEPGG